MEINNMRNQNTKTNADVLFLNFYIGLTVNIRETKYMEVGSHRGKMANEDFTVGIYMKN